MTKEWGISYIANSHNERATEDLWMTCDTEEQARKGMEYLRESERRGTISNLKLHIRHVTEWEPVDD